MKSIYLPQFTKYNFKKAFFFLKSTGISIFVVSGCWLLYQVRQTKLLLNSVVSTDILEAKNSQVQYIYIDDPRYKDIFTFTSSLADADISINSKPESFSHTIRKWLRTFNRHVAFRFLHLAQTGNLEERKKAVNALSQLTSLKDWHYQQIAQMLDARTAVALARIPEASINFFLNPPYFNIQYKLYDVIEKVHDLLLHLNVSCNGCHPCLVKFLQKKFQSSYRDTLEHDASTGAIPIPPPVIWDQEFLKDCVHAIHHHSSLDEHSRDIVSFGGLQTLMNVYQIVGDSNIEICILLAKIISNLSLYSEYLEDIFVSGWIRILTIWSRHSDIRLASSASRALINFDFDDNENEIYSQRIYPLYPLHRVPFKQDLDMIFIHGLLGGVFITWRQRDSVTPVTQPSYSDSTSLQISTMLDDYPPEFIKDLTYDLEVREWQKLGQDYELVLEDCPLNVKDCSSGPFFCKGDDKCVQQLEKDCKMKSQCWPKDWLPEDVPNLRLIGINYESNLSMWTPLCQIEGVRSTIKDRSEEFSKKLVKAGVGKRSIIWACHSMGGLLVKKLLVEEWKSGDKNNLLKNTKAIIFFSTPHKGSHVASLKQPTQMLLWPSIEVQELREQSPHLLQLQEDFTKMVADCNIDIISFGETKPTLVTALKVPFQFVNLKSADPGVGEFYEIPQDHLSICKPANRQSFLYQKMLAVIKHHLETTKKSEDFWDDPLLFMLKVFH